jgi:phosphonate transport system substrate-binding protein
VQFGAGPELTRCSIMARVLFASYLAPGVRPLYEFVAEACGARLVDGRDWRELALGRVDLAFVCSPPLIWLEGAVEAIAAPVLTDPRFGGMPLYCSDVVVRRDAPHRALEDLRGARWAYNEPGSWSGYWATLARVGAWDHFGSVVAAGSHQRALRMLDRGAIDGAAIDCQVLAVALRDDPGLAGRIRTIESLEPAPIQPVVVRTGLDAGAKRELRARLLALRGEVLTRFFVERFVPPPDYRPVASAIPAAPVDRPPAARRAR